MRNGVLVKITFAIVILVLIILVVFGKDIMAAVTEIITKSMAEQTGSLMDQLLR